MRNVKVKRAEMYFQTGQSSSVNGFFWWAAAADGAVWGLGGRVPTSTRDAALRGRASSRQSSQMWKGMGRRVG